MPSTRSCACAFRTCLDRTCSARPVTTSTRRLTSLAGLGVYLHTMTYRRHTSERNYVYTAQRTCGTLRERADRICRSRNGLGLLALDLTDHVPADVGRPRRPCDRPRVVCGLGRMGQTRSARRSENVMTYIRHYVSMHPLHPNQHGICGLKVRSSDTP